MSRTFDRYLDRTSKDISDDKVAGEVVVVVADEVAAWARAGTYLEKPVEDLPCIIPRWPLMWIEYPSHSGKERRGVLIHGEDSKALSPRGVKLRDAAEEDARSNGYDGEIKWAIEVVVFPDDGHKVFGPFGMVVFVLDPSGRVQGNRWEWWLSAPGPEREDPAHWLLAASMPALFTLSLLHCRNVATEEVRPHPKLSKKWQKRHGRPLARYQVLKMELPATRSSRGTSVGLGASTAVHVVGNHFAHYGDCCPGLHEPHGKLFGRLEGVYWFPLHLRGNPTLGTVKTDYVTTVNDEAARVALGGDQ